MKNFSKYRTGALLLLAGAIFPFSVLAQGYYYPPPPGYYPPYQQPPQYPQHQRPQQRRQPSRDQTREEDGRRNSADPKTAKNTQRSVQLRSAVRRQKDISSDLPPSYDMPPTTGPLISYTWNFNDTLADLAKASGITSNQILSMNNLALSQLRDGQMLRIPKLYNADADNLDIRPDRQSQLAREVWRGVRGKKRVALTYDAGGEPDALAILLKNLTDLKAPATFFVTGQFAEDHPDLVADISTAGFPQYNHSWSHPEFTTIGDDAIANELSRTDDILSSMTGRSTKPFWRPPFGDRDNRVLKSAAREGYSSIYWTLDTLDSVDDKKDSNFIVNRVLSPSKAKANPDHFLDGAIVLMHVGETGTANAVPAIVNGLRERGFTLVSLEEILQP